MGYLWINVHFLYLINVTNKVICWSHFFVQFPNSLQLIAREFMILFSLSDFFSCKIDLSFNLLYFLTSLSNDLLICFENTFVLIWKFFELFFFFVVLFYVIQELHSYCLNFLDLTFRFFYHGLQPFDLLLCGILLWSILLDSFLYCSYQYFLFFNFFFQFWVLLSYNLIFFTHLSDLRCLKLLLLVLNFLKIPFESLNFSLDFFYFLLKSLNLSLHIFKGMLFCFISLNHFL